MQQDEVTRTIPTQNLAGEFDRVCEFNIFKHYRRIRRIAY